MHVVDCRGHRSLVERVGAVVSGALCGAKMAFALASYDSRASKRDKSKASKSQASTACERAEALIDGYVIRKDGTSETKSRGFT